MIEAVLIAGFLGFIEGLTEFIPVSSTGHLILFSTLFNFNSGNHSFEIFIQLGAILAVAVFYRTELKSYISKPTEIYKYVIAVVPALLLGFLFHSHIKHYLFNPKSVAIALIAGAILLFFTQKIKTKTNEFTNKSAFILGLFQCLSLFPGFSRSGACIAGGLVQGIDKSKVADFSFILAIPVISMAALYDLYKNYHLLTASDIPTFAVGFITSFIFGFLSIKFFISFLKKYSLNVFIIYRIILGVIILAAS